MELENSDKEGPQKRRRRLDSFKCPQCGEKMLKKIVYGMPGEDFDFEKCFVGGCILSPEDIGCLNCEWTGFRSELDQVRINVSMVE